MRLLRELSRRKLRTTLTILGITIGIWALVVFSSMANKINALVEGGSQYYADKILVTDGSAFDQHRAALGELGEGEAPRSGRVRRAARAAGRSGGSVLERPGVRI